jgi:hypothetical protein
LSLEIPALAGCGLFVSELVRNRRMTLESQKRFRQLGACPSNARRA